MHSWDCPWEDRPCGWKEWSGQFPESRARWNYRRESVVCQGDLSVWASTGLLGTVEAPRVSSPLTVPQVDAEQNQPLAHKLETLPVTGPARTLVSLAWTWAHKCSFCLSRPSCLSSRAEHHPPAPSCSAGCSPSSGGRDSRGRYHLLCSWLIGHQRQRSTG